MGGVTQLNPPGPPFFLVPSPLSLFPAFYGTATMATEFVPVLLEEMPEVSKPVELLNE